MIRVNPNPPVDCDVCGAVITATLGGPFLDCEVVDLHDGTTPKDVCAACRSKPLSEIFPHILTRNQGHKMRPGVEPPAPAEDEPTTVGAGPEGEEPTPAA